MVNDVKCKDGGFLTEENLRFIEEVKKSRSKQKQVKVKIKKLVENAIIPTYAKQGDMGMDLTAIGYVYNEDMDCHIYHTGLAFELPEGYGMLLFPRSSNRKTDAYMTNHVGILDSGYRGELLICFKNRDKGNLLQPYDVGNKIAQLCILPYPKVEFIEVNELSSSERGEGGHGSTGK